MRQPLPIMISIDSAISQCVMRTAMAWVCTCCVGSRLGHDAVGLQPECGEQCGGLRSVRRKCDEAGGIGPAGQFGDRGGVDDRRFDVVGHHADDFQFRMRAHVGHVQQPGPRGAVRAPGRRPYRCRSRRASGRGSSPSRARMAGPSMSDAGEGSVTAIGLSGAGGAPRFAATHQPVAPRAARRALRDDARLHRGIQRGDPGHDDIVLHLPLELRQDEAGLGGEHIDPHSGRVGIGVAGGAHRRPERDVAGQHQLGAGGRCPRAGRAASMAAAGSACSSRRRADLRAAAAVAPGRCAPGIRPRLVPAARVGARPSWWSRETADVTCPDTEIGPLRQSACLQAAGITWLVQIRAVMVSRAQVTA